MPAKKKVTILYTNRIQFAPSGQDKIVLNLIEGKLANDYGRKRLEITDAECLRFAIQTTAAQWAEEEKRAINEAYIRRTKHAKTISKNK